MEADAAVDVFGGLGMGVGAGEGSAAIGAEPDLAVFEIDGGIGGSVGGGGMDGGLGGVELFEHRLELGGGGVTESGGVLEVDPGDVDCGIGICAGLEKDGRGLLREGGLLCVAMPIDIEDEKTNDDSEKDEMARAKLH